MENLRAEEEKQMENLIAGLRIESWSWEKIEELFQDSLSNIKSDEHDGENLGKYGFQ